MRAAYLVGCDGGNSLVRRQLDIKLNGEANIQQLRQALYYCDDLYERIPIGKGRHYHVADAEGSFLIVQDSTRHFTLHSVVDKDEDMATMFERVVAMPVKYEMLYVGQWKMNLLLADRYGEGRVFLAGDAVHLVIPTGGLGMNTGVGDAIDLSWKLAATLQGWGGPESARLLRDRAPAGRRAQRRGVRLRSQRTQDLAQTVSAGNPRADAAGAAARAELARVADVEQHKASEMIGAELGYRYAGSPLIAAEPGGRGAASTISWRMCRPPGRGRGCRTCGCDDGAAMQDRIGYGHGYTLLRLGGTRADTGPLQRAFAGIGAPLQVLDVRR